MRCPKCGYLDSKVLDTRSSLERSLVKRRRVCLRCSYKFSTNEVICVDYPMVVKRDGTQEIFDIGKIRNGLLKAFKKDSDGAEKINYIFNKVISDVVVKHSDRIQSAELGEIVMEALKDTDQVAYLRFASICKNFESPHDFASEFKKLVSEK